MTYGRYIADDGLPRWSLPESAYGKLRKLRVEIITSAIIECYADYGAAWIHRRMDYAPSVCRIRHYAHSQGIHVNARGRKVAWGICTEKHQKLRLRNRIAKMSGLPLPNNMPVGIPRKAIAMRYNLVRRYGYEYGQVPWLLYNANTHRRKDEEDLTRKYGFKFGAEEDAI